MQFHFFFLCVALASDRLFKSCIWGRKGECLSTSRCVWCLKSFAGFKHLFPNSQQPLIRAFNKTERRENQRVGMRRHVHPSKVTTFLDKRLPFPGGRWEVREYWVANLANKKALWYIACSVLPGRDPYVTSPICQNDGTQLPKTMG